MRQSFIIGAIMLFVVINFLGNIADQQALLAQTDSSTNLTQQQTLDSLMKPTIADSNIATVIIKVWDFLKVLGKTLTLWHPALWQGAALYLYLLFFIPIGISFWVVILMSIRGVGSS
jgi:hypothetical protein